MKKSAKKTRSGDYEIGKGRPPPATQFKRGQSGNPNGRPKGRKNSHALMNDELKKRIRIQDGGRVSTITVLEAIIRRLINLSLKGDLKSIEFILSKQPEMIQAVREIKKIHSAMSAQEAAEAYAQTLKLPSCLLP